MAKRKVCSTCKLFVEGDSCPSCKNNKFTNNWQGRIFILNPEQSIVAQKMGIKVKGEYAIKVR